jgi:uncharacterized protein DUF2330
MIARTWLVVSLAVALFAMFLGPLPAPGCCPAPPRGQPVVNADQTVIVIWDAASKTQHLIRQASFRSQAEDFGFLIPTPTQPTLAESGNEAFPLLRKLTEPAKEQRARPSTGMSCGCGGEVRDATIKSAVKVLEEKRVAGFEAVVLEAGSSDALIAWLKDHGYAFSPAVEAWARPYVESGWKITALKVAKTDGDKQKAAVATAALRLSFQTDRPLFPYREPDSKDAAEALGAKQRLLRVYFLADARYQGELTKATPWTGKVAWADKVRSQDRHKILEVLKLPDDTGPAQWWLTEFEDDWPYQAAPGDVYFARAPDQGTVKRPPIIEYTNATWPTDVTIYAIAATLVVTPVWGRYRRCRS